MRDDERYRADEWTPLEKRRLDSLPRARVPTGSLKMRTLTELRRRRLVRHRARSATSRGLWIAVAASVVFVTGGFVGYRLALPRFEAQARLATVAAGSPASDLSTNTGHVVWF